VHQKLKISLIRVGCHVVGILLNAIVKYFHAMSSHVFWLHYSRTLMCSSSLGRWKLSYILRNLGGELLALEAERDVLFWKV
jgi:hypothetical protein